MNTISSENTHRLHEMLCAAERIVIATHMKPDGDAIGSSLGMYHTLRLYGKKAVVVIPDPAPANLGFLTSVPDRDDLLIFGSRRADAEKAIAGCDLIICLDFNAFHRTDKLETPLTESKAQKILIDHHLAPARELFDLSFSETEVSSASEYLYHILSATSAISGVAAKLGRECADALMTGMTTDTNNFANSVYPSTLKMASDLLATGVDRDVILNLLYNQYGENRLRLMGHIMKDLLTITPDGVAYVVLDKQTQDKYTISEGDTEGFVNMPLSIAEVRMSIFAKEDTDRIRISIRSKKGTSANQCARMFFNGGGHENAAGGRLYIPENVTGVGQIGEYIEKNTHIFLSEQ